MVDHLLTRQQGKPIHLISDDVRRLALHYCVAVRKAANRLASELCEAVGHRLGLGPEQQQEVQRRIQDLIRERTQAGLLAARARGRQGGRPKSQLADEKKLAMAQKMYTDKTIPVKDILTNLGIKKTTFYKYLKVSETNVLKVSQ